MAETHVISALTKKRGELLGSIKHYKQLIKSLDNDLSTIDATIRIFEPDYEFSSTKIINKHSRKSYFERGEARALILNTMKEYKEPIKTDDLSNIISKSKNLFFNSLEEERNFQKTVVSVLNKLSLDNLVYRYKNEGKAIIWKIKDLN